MLRISYATIFSGVVPHLTDNATQTWLADVIYGEVHTVDRSGEFAWDGNTLNCV